MGTRFAALLFALICVLAANDSEGRKLSEAIVDDGASLDVEETNDGDSREDYRVAVEGIDSGFQQTSPNVVESSSKKILSISQSIPRMYRHRSRKRRALITASAADCSDTNQRYIVAALVAYSVLVVVLVFLLLFVCLKIRRKHWDDFPHPILGTTDTSAGTTSQTVAPPEPPPPPPETAAPPPPPGKSLRLRRRTSTVRRRNATGKSIAPKPKLKPFFWDKLHASSDNSMVWHEIKSGSFQFNEEKMETLFGCTVPADKNKTDHKKEMLPLDSPRFIQIIETKKSQNLAILLKALNVTTEEVCDALKEGNELPLELTQSLVRMAPTEDEELKLRLYDGDIAHLGPVERFLKALVDIPFAFKRMESLLFVNTFEEEFPSTKESLESLEVACKELKSSRLFLKLLEAVLKTGNRMNDGSYRGCAQAFKLDTLLKLSDVKGSDGKTTLLHFLVEEIIHSEGIRSAHMLGEIQSVETDDAVEEYSKETEEYHWGLGLEAVLGLGDELQNVKKAAVIHNDNLSQTVSKLEEELNKTKWFLDVEMNETEEESEFCDALAGFVEDCESDIMWLKEEEKRVMTLVKSTWDYFHGQGGKEEGSHLFVIVSDFLLMLEKACVEVKDSLELSSNTAKKEGLQLSPVSSPTMKGSCSESANEIHSELFPVMGEKQLDDDFSLKKKVSQQLDDEFSLENEASQQLDDDFILKKEVSQQLDDDFSLEKEVSQQLDDDFSLKKEASQQLDDEVSQQLDDSFSLKKEASQQLDDDFSLKKETSQQLDDTFSLNEEASQQLDDSFSLKKEVLQSSATHSPTVKESCSESENEIHSQLLPATREHQLDDDFSSDEDS